jgi:protein TonB
MNCGAPMEAQSIERVKYTLDASGAKVEVIQSSDTPRISSGVAATLVTHKVNPTYPDDAKQAGLQGMVVLQLKIGKDGQPHDIKLVSGLPQLAPAAIDAVSQWRYTPYRLNGQDVEVETTVQINFTLRR